MPEGGTMKKSSHTADGELPLIIVPSAGIGPATFRMIPFHALL
jgi:hypothetical protein